MIAQIDHVNAWGALKADTFRQYGLFSWRRLITGALTKRNFRVIVTMRLCQLAASSRGGIRVLLPLFKIFHGIATHHAAIDLSWKTQVGPGLAITHGWGLVVNPKARIGANVTLFNGVTLGRRDRISQEGARMTEYPQLEDEVWVGPHAIIVGGVTIGRGSRVAGGAFVTESVMPNSVVSGNPAAIVKDNCIADVMNPAPINGSATSFESGL
ncbi:serine acetyltransferase [Thiobacillus sedimenti]|uniref:Serine acetyltransferase n=1 Tax=Thiobacillus sedimenti TaxID=3110231 RepID=A0ABZ1CG17_9PROT|nr:serine acetyltransferase [Thiobacillus sp. SCUT-2]WRS38326.1 serine acetyltransferase [Thiobacillus sp. SCUT-2]